VTPPTPNPVDGTTDSTEIRVLLARFETKLDLVIGQHGETLKDHEARLRAVEDRRVVTPAALLGSLVGVVTVLVGVVSFLDRLYS
jgi:hypothetical protein